MCDPLLLSTLGLRLRESVLSLFAATNSRFEYDFDFQSIEDKRICKCVEEKFYWIFFFLNFIIISDLSSNERGMWDIHIFLISIFI